MNRFDAGETLADRFRAHAGDNTHLYADAMRGMAADWEAGGPVREVCLGYETAPAGSLIQLRLLAGVFRLVLTGAADALLPFYPCLGGEQDPAKAWPVMRGVIADHVDYLHHALAVAPQTNEIGRSAALLAGLFDLVAASGRQRIRLLEVGASAGLNLLVDRYRFVGPGWHWGPENSPVHLLDPIQGAVQPVSFTVAETRGCDLHPIDAGTTEGRLLLTSFVWPFDVHRHRRLASALQVAEAQPVVVDRASAGEWLTTQLARPVDQRTLTVVWHSITQMYWSAEEVAVVDRILTIRGHHLALGQVSMEYGTLADSHSQPEVSTDLWLPDRTDEVRHRFLGTAHDHGIPVRLTAAGPAGHAGRS